MFHLMEGLKECEANLLVYLHPFKAKCANRAILGELSSLLFKHSETFEGVFLAYDPNIRYNLAKVSPGLYPHFGVKLKVNLLLFNPKPGMLLEGDVVKLTPHSIYAVVLRLSSAVIACDNIHGQFKHKYISLMKRSFIFLDLCLLNIQDVLDGWIQIWTNGLKQIGYYLTFCLMTQILFDGWIQIWTNGLKQIVLL